MKVDITTRIYKNMGISLDQGNFNRNVKAVILNFGDERGDIIVENGNFGTRRKYADFTEGKKKAGLNPMQIVFTSIELAHAMHDRYIDRNDQVRTF